ncbi:sporulation kinase A [bacterium BMS3Abin09]|nr:sporulation kinase A [bacterium BMS3Abin09]
MFKELYKRVSALIYIRVLLVTILLGSFYIFKVGYEKLIHPAAFSFFIIFLYLLTIAYALILRRVKNKSHFIAFAYIQIIIDIIAETVLLYMTGGIGSMFSIMFPLSILSAGIVLSRRACYIIATLSSIFYGMLLDLQLFKIFHISTASVFSAKDFFYNIFAHIVAFYLIAFLGGYLAEKLHKATKSLEHQDTVVSDLKAFSRYVIESMSSGVFTTGLNGRIIIFNSSAQEITKLDHAAVIGKRPADIFPFLDNLMNSLGRMEGDIESGGVMVPVGMRLSSLKDGTGESIGIIGVFQDLTELKEMEEEVNRKEKWAFIGELSASIAHELRNPLASLKGSIEMLREKKVSEEYADYLMKIALSEMDRLNGIITDFLLYAKPQEINRESFDLQKALEDIAALLRSSEKNGKDVTIIARPAGALNVNGDAKKLQQVFWNLGLNAVNAAPDKGVIDIYTEQRWNVVEVVFSDNGPGIDPDDMERIFYPFFTTKESGTGLGLSIAMKIAEEHGGNIIAESKGPGKGSTFRVILPLSNK